MGLGGGGRGYFWNTYVFFSIIFNEENYPMQWNIKVGHDNQLSNADAIPKHSKSIPNQSVYGHRSNKKFTLIFTTMNSLCSDIATMSALGKHVQNMEVAKFRLKTIKTVHTFFTFYKKHNYKFI